MRRALSRIKGWLGTHATPCNRQVAEQWPSLTQRQINAAVYATQILLDNEPQWVHRRVEHVEFLDKGQTYRRVTVDFTLPRLEGNAPVQYVPLSIVRKHLLKRLDVRSEDGTALPVLTRRENAPIAAKFLLRVARLRLAPRFVIPEAGVGSSAPVDPDIAALIEDLHLVAGDHEETDPEDARRLEHDAFERLRNPTTAVGRALWEDVDYAQPWISELGGQFILFVETDIKPLKRRIIKFAYEEALGNTRLSASWWAWVFVQLWRIGGNVLESLGLRAYNALFPAQAIADGESYHVEISAPEGLFISCATLKTRKPGADDWQERARDGGTDLAALHAFAVPPEDVEISIVDVFFRLRPSGLLVAAAFSSWVTSGIVWLGLYLHHRGAGTNRDALTVLLVALPALFAAYLIPGEHRLTRSMFKGLRLLVFLSALISFTAASVLALDFSHAGSLGLWGLRFNPSISRIWLVLGSVSAAVTCVVTVALASSWGVHRFRRNPTLRPADE